MDKAKTETAQKAKVTKKAVKKSKGVDELTTDEREAVTIVFHQFETGLREGTIDTKVMGLRYFCCEGKMKTHAGCSECNESTWPESC